MTRVLLGIPDDLVTEDDPNLAVGGFALHRFEAGLLGGLRVETLDVALELAHQEEDPDDHQWPRDEHDEEERLIRGHTRECRV